MDAADLICDARGRAGLTIRQLALRAGTSHSAIAAYESGAKVPGGPTLERILRSCGFGLRAELEPLAPFEDRRARGRELIDVLDLAEQFPARHGVHISARFS